jgi:hypothetical protein
MIESHFMQGSSDRQRIRKISVWIYRGKSSEKEAGVNKDSSGHAHLA